MDVKSGQTKKCAKMENDVEMLVNVLRPSVKRTHLKREHVVIVGTKYAFVWMVNGQPGRHVAERANLTTNVHATIVDPNCENVCPMASGAHGMNAKGFRRMISCVIPMVSVNVNPMAAAFTSPNNLEI